MGSGLCVRARLRCCGCVTRAVLLRNVLQRDPLIAKQLFSSLCSGILKELDKHSTASERRGATQKLLQDFTHLLSTTVLFFPPFVSCIQVRPHAHRLPPFTPAKPSDSVGFSVETRVLTEQMSCVGAAASQTVRRSLFVLKKNLTYDGMMKSNWM